VDAVVQATTRIPLRRPHTRNELVQVTFLGHAGMYIETNHGSILCDPVFNSSYFGSWWVYPANDQLDFSPFVNPDYLFLSHTHLDHFDVKFLSMTVR
jgi:UDP-MurNAc hydroxylase